MESETVILIIPLIALLNKCGVRMKTSDFLSVMFQAFPFAQMGWQNSRSSQEPCFFLQIFHNIGMC